MTDLSKMDTLSIHPDITQAETLPAWFYRSPQVFDQMTEKVFAKSWQFIGDAGLLPLHDSVYPFTLLEHHLNEPMLLVRNRDGQINNLSNVCTHRANILVHHPATMNKIVCRYHGRRFSMDGTFESMPEFKDAQQFPRPCDNLHQFPVQTWEQFLFTSLDPNFPLSPADEMGAMAGFQKDALLGKDPLKLGIDPESKPCKQLGSPIVVVRSTP